MSKERFDEEGKSTATSVAIPGELSGIKIRVRGVADGRQDVELHHDAKILEHPAFQDRVDIVGHFTKDGERVTLDAEVKSEGQFECTRCADPFARLIKAPLHVEFIPEGADHDPDDPNIHEYPPLASSFIDITQDVLDALVLAIPMKHLCKPDCKGLCPVCGKDQNKETCNHITEIGVTPQFAALKSVGERLRAEEETEGGA